MKSLRSGEYAKKIFVFIITFFLSAVSFTPVARSESEIEIIKRNMEMLQRQMELLRQKLETLEKKSKQREKAVRSIIEEKKERDALLEKKKAKPVIAFWKNDFILSTPDESFWMKIRGNLHFDSKFYDGGSKNPTEFDVRRARMDFQGAFYKYIRFRIQAEFADSPYIRNAWADYKFRDWLHLRAGQMKPPFSTAWWTLDNRVNFIERGANTPLYPYFDRGWWLWGDVFNHTLTWNVGAFTGAGMELDEKKGEIDDHKDYIGRLFWSPFVNKEGSLLEGLHLCLEGTLGRESVPTKRFEKKGFGAGIRDDKFWTWATGDNAEIDHRNRLGAELHYIHGPFSFSTEYLKVFYKGIKVYAPDGTKVIDDDGRITSWSTWVSYFLTGERKSVSNFGWKQPAPKQNFDPVNLKGKGAWEILFRYTMTDASRSLFDTYNYGGNSYTILKGSHYVNEFTVGLSWTWNPMVRWQFNYIYLDGNGFGIRSGDREHPAGIEWRGSESMFGMRMIFKY
ncbi:MAG: hypothetical protein DRG25_03075 [Deltaproteobacteria bacterium]|nr:MAG: hypothetical protein DRG25_03075 [Deltaproteobacteria bacterium]